MSCSFLQRETSSSIPCMTIVKVLTAFLTLAMVFQLQMIREGFLVRLYYGEKTSNLNIKSLGHDDNSTNPNMTTTITPKIKNATNEEQAATTTSPSPSTLLLPLRVCNKSSLFIPHSPDITNVTLEYQCNGTEYDQFARALHNFSHSYFANYHSSTWGRRPTILPDDAHVLFLGNSHTKQTFMELACQYSDQLVALVRLKQYPYAQEFVFRNNASIVLVFNSPVDIAIDWVSELEAWAKRPLSSFSAVVLGQFNKMSKNTNYYTTMMKWAVKNKNMQVGHDSPDVTQLAQHFAGPIVFLSSFNKSFRDKAEKALNDMNEIQNSTNRTNNNHNNNMHAILSLKFIDLIDSGNECISVSRLGTSECIRASDSASHRCVGLQGGYPTLSAHDVQEALFTLLLQEKQKESSKNNQR